MNNEAISTDQTIVMTERGRAVGRITPASLGLKKQLQMMIDAPVIVATFDSQLWGAARTTGSGLWPETL